MAVLGYGIQNMPSLAQATLVKTIGQTSATPKVTLSNAITKDKDDGTTEVIAEIPVVISAAHMRIKEGDVRLGAEDFVLENPVVKPDGSCEYDTRVRGIPNMLVSAAPKAADGKAEYYRTHNIGDLVIVAPTYQLREFGRAVEEVIKQSIYFEATGVTVAVGDPVERDATGKLIAWNGGKPFGFVTKVDTSQSPRPITVAEMNRGMITVSGFTGVSGKRAYLKTDKSIVAEGAEVAGDEFVGIFLSDTELILNTESYLVKSDFATLAELETGTDPKKVPNAKVFKEFVDKHYDYADKAEAEGATAPDKVMSPLSTQQLLDKHVVNTGAFAYATKAAAEQGTDDKGVMTPERTKQAMLAQQWQFVSVRKDVTDKSGFAQAYRDKPITELTFTNGEVGYLIKSDTNEWKFVDADKTTILSTFSKT